MTTAVVTISDDASITIAEKLLFDRGVHGAPVVDREGRLAGIVSQTDLLAWHSAGGGSCLEDASEPGSIRLVMTGHAHAVRRNTSSAVAAALMIRRRIHRLLVVDRDLRPVGIVTAFDLLRLVPGVRGLLAGDES
jgi:CBS domain-containing protein